ncbi:MAG TPA: heparinase, partial [Opitutaceae bacterium]|nr:heparinase [Opitutaceae bacterium]
WLYSTLSDDDRATVRDALRRHALAFAPAAYGPPGATGAPTRSSDRRLHFVTAHHNWNQVCNTGLLAAALALADEEPDLARTVIAGARRSLPLAMKAYEPDGAYPEGPGYWTYGTSYNVLGIALLESALGTDLGLSQMPSFDRAAL